MINSKEKKFKIEVIASVIEVCYLTNPEDVLEFCSYVMGFDVNPSNMYEHYEKINNAIKLQYPNLERKTFLGDGCVMKPHKIIELVNLYKKEHGEYLTIKTVNPKRINKLKLIPTNK